jgi:large subunit ribosomal protein L9
VKVILSENIAHLGEIGAEVKVSEGYARNFLLPRKLAVSADSGSAKQIEHEKKIIANREAKMRDALSSVAKDIEKLTVEIKARAGEGDKLFGSVTTSNIADGLKELGHEIDRRNITLAEPIKALGIFTVQVKLGAGVEATVKVWVTKDTPEGEEVGEVEAAAEEAPAEAPAEVSAEVEAEAAPTAEPTEESQEKAE